MCAVSQIISSSAWRYEWTLLLGGVCVASRFKQLCRMLLARLEVDTLLQLAGTYNLASHKVQPLLCFRGLSKGHFVCST